MKLSSDETPSVFPSPGQRTLSLDTHPKRSILTGQWSDDNVNVGIRSILGIGYEVTLADSTPGRACSVTTTCSFGTGGLAQVFTNDHVLESLVSANTVGSSYTEVARASVAIAGVSAALRTAGVLAVNGASSLGLSTAKAFTAASLKKDIHEIGIKDSPVLSVLAEAAAEHANECNYTLWPTPEIALQLYQELEEGRLAGYRLLYQRVLGDGTVLGSAFLTFRPAVN